MIIDMDKSLYIWICYLVLIIQIRTIGLAKIILISLKFFKIFSLEYLSQIWDNTPYMNKAEEYYDSGVEKANSRDYQEAIKELDFNKSL